MKRVSQALLCSMLATGGLRADFTYEETSKITGGAIVGMMKFAGAFSKDARRATEPINSTIAIKGNRMIRKSQYTATITDLDAETITTVNFDKKTYSTMTFAQMRQAMDDMSKQMEKSSKSDASKPDMSNVKFKVDVRDTGATKNINGIPAHEMILTMTMEGTDQQSGAKGGMDITTDSWIAPAVPGYEEVRVFYRRMAEKLDWVPGAGMFNRPDIAKGMAEIYKEGSKLDGIPVMQIVRMGGTVDNMQQNGDGSGDRPRQSTSSSSSAPPTSVGGAIGSALGGRFGLGGRKKQQQEQQQQPADSGSPGSASGSLMEMTMELTNYSSAPVDGGMFAVPAGYKQVDAEMGNRRAR
jgi:hypothetical protein